MSLFLARHVFASKRNSFTRLLDMFQTLLQDQRMAAVHLEGWGMMVNGAWDRLTAAHDALREVQTKDEGEEQQYNDLYIRCLNLSSRVGQNYRKF